MSVFNYVFSLKNKNCGAIICLHWNTVATIALKILLRSSTHSGSSEHQATIMAKWYQNVWVRVSSDLQGSVSLRGHWELKSMLPTFFSLSPWWRAVCSHHSLNHSPALLSRGPLVRPSPTRKSLIWIIDLRNWTDIRCCMLKNEKLPVLGTSSFSSISSGRWTCVLWGSSFPTANKRCAPSLWNVI